MKEIWADIPGYSGYQISNMGRLRTFREKRGRLKAYITDRPRIMSVSDDGNGYMKAMLYGDDGRRKCMKIHRLVAETFIPNPLGLETVDHIKSGPEGKLDNSVANLRWVSRRDNIQKAYKDGVCDERIRNSFRPIWVIDLIKDTRDIFRSIKEAAESLGIDRSSISHVLIGDIEKAGRYTFEYADREEVLTYGYDKYFGSCGAEWDYC